MDRDLSNDLTSRMPIIADETIAGVDCCGCIIAAVDGSNVGLRGNDGEAVVGVVQIDVMRGLLGLDCAEAKCPHCGYANVFPGFDKMTAYTCENCGRSVDAASRD